MWVKDVFPPTQQAQLASDPEKKKNLISDLKMIIAVGQHAEAEGYAERPELKSQLAIQSDILMREIYEKKNPGKQVTDDEVNAYHQKNPNDFNSFLDSNPRLKQQAQGPQAERLKKEYGEIKVLAELARQDGIDKEKSTEIRLLLDRSQVLYQAYLRDFQESMGEPETDADIEQYLKDHQEEFKRVRHILISTEPPAPSLPGAASDEPEKKALTKDEARQKAQSILDRIRNGEDFATLAQENSDDPGSKEKGGDLGLVTQEDPLVPEFKTAAFALKPGEISELVETQFGIHIIKVEALEASAVSDPQTRQKIAQEIQQSKIKKHIDEIVANSRVEIAEDFKIDPPPPAPQPDLMPPAGATPPPSGNQ